MKLKLEIQRFSSTNATTHYELSQYIGTDKPTYLVDYNSDMNKIDTAIYGADSQATQNANNIGTMSNLNTTEKSSLVGAINEVNTQVGINTGNISTNTSNIGTLGTNQGVMANLTTTEKSSLVGAINEVDAENGTQQTAINKNTSDITTLNNKFNFTNINSYGTSNVSISGTGASVNSCDLTVASNSDYSIMKVYGKVIFTTGTNYGNTITITNAIPSDARPSTDIIIKNSIIPFCSAPNVYLEQYNTAITIKANGNIELTVAGNNNTSKTMAFYSIPVVIFVKDFGDTPIGE